jgi:hypothetical protein
VAPLRLGGLRGKKSTPSVWLGGTGELELRSASRSSLEQEQLGVLERQHFWSKEALVILSIFGHIMVLHFVKFTLRWVKFFPTEIPALRVKLPCGAIMTFPALETLDLFCCFLIVGARHRALSSLLGKGVFTSLGLFFFI